MPAGGRCWGHIIRKKETSAGVRQMKLKVGHPNTQQRPLCTRSKGRQGRPQQARVHPCSRSTVHINQEAGPAPEPPSGRRVSSVARPRVECHSAVKRNAARTHATRGVNPKSITEWREPAWKVTSGLLPFVRTKQNESVLRDGG